MLMFTVSVFLMLLTSYIKHAKWPGFVSYHRANSDIHGYAYFGDGRKLTDIHFLI